jgi:hypothetical protein
LTEAPAHGKPGIRPFFIVLSIAPNRASPPRSGVALDIHAFKKNAASVCPKRRPLFPRHLSRSSRLERVLQIHHKPHRPAGAVGKEDFLALLPGHVVGLLLLGMAAVALAAPLGLITIQTLLQRAAPAIIFATHRLSPRSAIPPLNTYIMPTEVGKSHEKSSTVR